MEKICSIYIQLKKPVQTDWVRDPTEIIETRTTRSWGPDDQMFTDMKSGFEIWTILKKLVYRDTNQKTSKSCFCFQSNQTQGLCSKAQRHPKAFLGLKPDNFHCPTRIFWCLLRSSAVDAVRTINPEEPPMSPPGRWEMVG